MAVIVVKVLEDFMMVIMETAVGEFVELMAVVVLFVAVVK